MGVGNLIFATQEGHVSSRVLTGAQNRNEHESENEDVFVPPVCV